RLALPRRRLGARRARRDCDRRCRPRPSLSAALAGHRVEPLRGLRQFVQRALRIAIKRHFGVLRLAPGRPLFRLLAFIALEMLGLVTLGFVARAAVGLGLGLAFAAVRMRRTRVAYGRSPTPIS